MSVRTFLGKGVWDMNVTGFDILFMAFEAVIYFCAAIAIEYFVSVPAVVAKCKKDPQIPMRIDSAGYVPDDVDIVRERNRMQQAGAENTDMIRVEGLRKTYKPSKVSVEDVWFGIPKGECFGFLGVNGAGKTTTLKMLSGDVIPTAGTAYLGGHNIMTNVVEVRRLIGYCPQFDALHQRLTGKETLEFYGRIRGIPEDRLPSMIEYLLGRLSLTQYADVPAGQYSGGNRRKLSVGVALIGNPKIVFLDEPSTGMDPVSRRFMWNFISETMADRSVILTTHSMEECEALCNRIGILVRGELKCIGSSQHLKHRYGRGFQIDVSVDEEKVEQAQAFFHQTFPGISVLEIYGGHIKYQTKSDPNVTLRSIFSIVEKHRAEMGIIDYSVGQTTLEQIFINFAKEGARQEALEAEAKAAERFPKNRAGASAAAAGNYQQLQNPVQSGGSGGYVPPQGNIAVPSTGLGSAVAPNANGSLVSTPGQEPGMF
jgi:ABC-type multidrug transport system ATPase subunit